jgi:hypothetical protein
LKNFQGIFFEKNPKIPSKVFFQNFFGYYTEV